MYLETDRLVLRSWTEEDRAPFSALNNDPDVMRYFPSLQSLEVSNASIAKRMKHDREYGVCFWAADLRDTGQFIGFVGIEYVAEDIPGKGSLEIGWRIDKDHWGKGLAPEGAKACLAYAFGPLKVTEVVSFTSKNNLPSQRVMEKIGMTREHENDFDHPAVLDGHPIKPHVFYRIKAADFAF